MIRSVSTTVRDSETADFNTQHCLCVIVPVYNERSSVEAILERILKRREVAQVIVVDDCSVDGTKQMVQSLLGRDTRLTLVCHSINRGKGAAIITGLASATAPYVLIQDADLEYDPADYRLMLQPVLTGQADVVYGSRFLARRRVTSLPHRLINWGLTALANLFTGLELTDVHTCLKLFPTALIQKIPLAEQRFGFCPEVTAKLAKIPQLRLVEVPVSYYPRQKSAGKKIGLRDGFRAIYCILKYSFGPRNGRAWVSQVKIAPPV